MMLLSPVDQLIFQVQKLDPAAAAVPDFVEDKTE